MGSRRRPVDLGVVNETLVKIFGRLGDIETNGRRTNERLDTTIERLDTTVERLDQTVERLDQTVDRPRL